RFVHVIDNWSYYSNNPGQILAIWSGGIGLFGAILGGFLGGAAYAVLSKYPVGKLADATAPALLIAQTIGRIGDVINGEHITRLTSMPGRLVYTHPQSPAFGLTGQYPVIELEMLWNMIALVIVWQLRGRLRPHGMLFALYLALYSIGRFSISFLRDDRVWIWGLQEAHFISLAILAITVPLLAWKARLVPRKDEAISDPPRASKARLKPRFRRGR
ncbi:MAG: prolipoprotein diacylglyceryl transferase, partial [Chloroflexi bacterium]|nr:prolipoprotein diacylglyceryl transferase [Chloroflexota bacterium]